MQRSLSCAVVHLDNLRHNYELITETINRDTRTIPIIKADAYGHGMLKVAEALSDYDNIAYFGIAHTQEGLSLRKKGIHKNLLLLSCINPQEFELMHNYNLTPVIHSLSLLKNAVEFSRNTGKKLKAHLKFDTGMARLGISQKEAEEAIEICKKYAKHITVEGVMSHFSESESNPDWTETQMRRFDAILAQFEDEGIYPEYRHIANSAAIFTNKKTHYNCVRPGLSLYGYLGKRELTEKAGLKPVLEIRSKLISIHELKKGEGISYGRTFIAEKEMRVGVVAFGYADGLFRILSNRAHCAVKGKRCKIIGTICMDMFMCDLTNVNAEPFDTVTILGGDDSSAPTAEELAELADTISYEILTNIGKSTRVRRIFKG